MSERERERGGRKITGLKGGKGGGDDSLEKHCEENVQASSWMGEPQAQAGLIRQEPRAETERGEEKTKKCDDDIATRAISG